MRTLRHVIAAWLMTAAALSGVVIGSQTNAPRAAATAPATTVPFDTFGWNTDFSRHSVPLTEIMSGGPPKDGIPAIDRPEFVSVSAADEWLKPKEPVILFERDGEARAYPLEILIWHEIVNDTVAGLPVTITFCPLCHTAIAFDRRTAGRVLDFGTTGRLRFSDLVMYDRQTETWWQQATGEGIVGTLTGTRLTALPAQIIAWATFKHAFPDGRVLSRHTGYSRSYGSNPYTGYDNVDASPFLYRGPTTDRRLRPMDRVVTISAGAENVAYPFSLLERLHVINDTAGGRPITVFFVPGVTSTLDDSNIAASRDIGTAAVFDRRLNGRPLTFHWTGQQITDRETGSVWTILGRAEAGPLRSGRLPQVVHGQQFWFSWAAFRPGTRVYDTR
jgi:uncharacterized protein DUF3179